MSDDGMKAIAAAMQQVREKVGYVHKGGVNQHFKYSFASEGDFLRAIRPAMVEAGLMMLPEQRISNIDERTGNAYVEIRYTLVHKDGHVWPEKIVGLGCGNDRTNAGKDGDKAVFKALTGANKYALRHLFQIETGDDPEEDRQPPAREEPDMDVYHKVMERIAATETTKDLESYWRSTQMMLADFNIVNKVGHPGSKPYAEIVNAVRLRVEALKKPPVEEQKSLPKPALNDEIPF